MENQIRLLVVDDEQDVTHLLSMRLNRRGFACVAAHSGEAALESLARQPAHVVVMDVMMPGMGGMEALQRIKAAWPQTAVILLSGHANMQIAVDAMRTGAFGYLMKPVDFDELVFKIEDAAAQLRLEARPDA